MMRKDEIFSPTMNVECLPQIFLTHHRTFDMPAWPSFSPWTFPPGFSRFARFPEGEIERVFFLFINLYPSTGLHLFQVPPGEFSIIFKFLHGKKDIAPALVGISFFYKD